MAFRIGLSLVCAFIALYSAFNFYLWTRILFSVWSLP